MKSIESYSLTENQVTLLITACGLYIATSGGWATAPEIFNYSKLSFAFGSLYGLVIRGLIQKRRMETITLYQVTQTGLALGDELTRRQTDEAKPDQNNS